jgi:hypothetical protein
MLARDLHIVVIVPLAFPDKIAAEAAAAVIFGVKYGWF